MVDAMMLWSIAHMTFLCLMLRKISILAIFGWISTLFVSERSILSCQCWSVLLSILLHLDTVGGGFDSILPGSHSNTEQQRNKKKETYSWDLSSLLWWARPGLSGARWGVRSYRLRGMPGAARSHLTSQRILFSDLDIKQCDVMACRN